MRVLGLDLGTKTIGIAISDRLGIVATGLENFTYIPNDYESCYKHLQEIVEKNQITEIVIGLPKHMNGDEGEKVEFVRKFVEGLKKVINLPVNELDERWTTKLANNYLLQADISRAKRKKVIDMMSAVVILQDYLDAKGGKL